MNWKHGKVMLSFFNNILTSKELLNYFNQERIELCRHKEGFNMFKFNFLLNAMISGQFRSTVFILDKPWASILI